METRPLFSDGAPNWETIDFEILCSRCGYNLRMLQQSRCPECGLEFDWRRILQACLDASSWKSDFLFEHHWRTRPIRSWLKTTWAAFRPFRFWGDVSIHDRVQPGPLWFLLLTSIFWFALTLNALGWLSVLALKAIYRLVNPRFMNPQWEFLDRARQDILQMLFNPNNSRGYFWLLCFLLISLLAALAMLCGLQQTLVRCRVRRIQLLRVFAYTSTPAMVCLATIIIVGYAGLSGFIDDDKINPVLVVCFVVCVLTLVFGCPILFLTAGLKRYLQLPRAPLLAAAAVLTGFLFAQTMFAFIRF